MKTKIIDPIFLVWTYVSWVYGSLHWSKLVWYVEIIVDRNFRCETFGAKVKLRSSSSIKMNSQIAQYGGGGNMVEICTCHKPRMSKIIISNVCMVQIWWVWRAVDGYIDRRMPISTLEGKALWLDFPPLRWWLIMLRKRHRMIRSRYVTLGYETQLMSCK